MLSLSMCVCVCILVKTVSHYVKKTQREKNIPRKKVKKSDNIIFIWLHSSEWNNVDFSYAEYTYVCVYVGACGERTKKRFIDKICKRDTKYVIYMYTYVYMLKCRQVHTNTLKLCLDLAWRVLCVWMWRQKKTHFVDIIWDVNILLH